MAEVEYTGWGGRLGKAIVGIPIGIILFLASFAVLFWNEGNSVHTARSLEEGAAASVSVAPDKVDPGNEGKLVHTTGDATTTETLKDDLFGVSANALKLKRNVQIYQYKETAETKTEKQVGGGEKKTTYFYHAKEWVDQPIDSSGFHKDDKTGEFYTNVGTKPYEDETKRAKEVTLGAFKLTDKQVDRMGEGERLPATSQMRAALPTDLKSKLNVTNDGYFYQPFRPEGDPSAPEIGDVRIAFEVLKPQKVSLIAKQVQGSFEPWHSKEGGKDIDDLRLGSLSKEAMFEQLQKENAAMTWILRLVGFVLMAAGIFLVLRPFATFADFLPFFGDLASAAIALFAIVVALPLTLITIALGWVFYRPLVGIPLLVVGLGIIGGTFYLVRKNRAAKLEEKKRDSRRGRDEEEDEDRPRKKRRVDDDDR